MLNDMIMVLAKNHSQPIHWHEKMEINLVLAGEMDVMCNEHVYRVVAGDVMVINSNDAHSIKRLTDDLRYIQLQMNLIDFNYYVPHISEKRFYCTSEGNNAMSNGLKMLLKKYVANIVRYAEHPDTTIDPDRKIIYCCSEILGGLSSFFSIPEDQRQEQAKDFKLQEAWKALSYIQKNIYRHITIEEVSEELGLSTDEIEKRVMRRIGCSFDRFVEAMRVAISMRDLMQTEKSIMEIAKENGFLSINQYRIAFFESYGRTPDEYRKRSIRFLQERRRGGSDAIVFDEEEMRDQILTMVGHHEDLSMETKEVLKEITIDVSAFDTEAFDNKPAEELKKELAELVKNSENSVWKLNLKNSLEDMVSYCISPEKGIYAWRDGKATKILLAKGTDTTFSKAVLKIDGLDPYETYVCCRKKTADIPASMREMVFSKNAGELNEDILYNVHEMACSYSEYNGEPHVHMIISLKEEQLEKIIIQKINTK